MKKPDVRTSRHSQVAPLCLIWQPNCDGCDMRGHFTPQATLTYSIAAQDRIVAACDFRIGASADITISCGIEDVLNPYSPLLTDTKR